MRAWPKVWASLKSMREKQDKDGLRPYLAILVAIFGQSRGSKRKISSLEIKKREKEGRRRKEERRKEQE